MAVTAVALDKDQSRDNLSNNHQEHRQLEQTDIAAGNINKILQKRTQQAANDHPFHFMSSKPSIDDTGT